MKPDQEPGDVLVTPIFQLVILPRLTISQGKLLLKRVTRLRNRYNYGKNIA
jgi:hypothetical protein